MVSTQPVSTARHNAEKRLIAAHYDEFRTIYHQERERLGIPVAEPHVPGLDILDQLIKLPDGDVLCIVQAASEQLPGPVSERLVKGYREIVGEDPS